LDPPDTGSFDHEAPGAHLDQVLVAVAVADPPSLRSLDRTGAEDPANLWHSATPSERIADPVSDRVAKII
jgi:hypothetical protein